MTDIQKLTPRHFKILDLALAGLQAVDIARRLEMSPTQVNNVLRSPSFQHQFALRRSSLNDQLEDVAVSEVEEIKDEVKEVLRNGALSSAKKLVDLVDCPDPRISMKSAAEVLDRSGYAREMPTQDNSTNINVVIGNKQAVVIKETLDMLSLCSSLEDCSSSTPTTPADI